MKKYCLITLATLLLSGQVLAAANMQSPDPKELTDLLGKSGGQDLLIESKIKSVHDEAMVLGAIGGFAYECGIVVKKIDSRSQELSHMYNFQSLLTQNGVMLPVIEEAKEKVTVEEQTITSAGSVYRIIKPARFVRIAPTYRDYLLAGLNCESEAKKAANFSFRLKEISPKAWSDGIKEGWEVGRERALATLDSNMAKINRDYLGMIKFRRLEMIGAIQMPEIAQSQYNARIGVDKIETGVRSMKIAKPSKFAFDASRWNPELGIASEDSNASETSETENFADSEVKEQVENPK